MTRMLSIALVAAQTVITPPANSYSLAEDVRLGQQAAAQVEQQLPIMRDDEVTSYIDGIGRRLVAAIPPEFQHPEFRYTFKAVNVRDINAFALPGGPMFVNRGMIEAAHTEGEVAGVMAHELSHVALRHGTAQSSKANRYAVGSLVGAIAGAIIGGPVGTVVAEGARFGIGATFLRFSRDYERQADLEGSHIMAAAGYDPRDMASMFKTIEERGGPGGPQWLSDHPNPGDRYSYILREAESLRIEHPLGDAKDFEQVQTHLKRLQPAPTTQEATRTAGRTGTPVNSEPPDGNVEPPSSQYTKYRAGTLFQVSVPANWRELQGRSAVTFAPQGAYGTVNGQSIFTHGVKIGLARSTTRDLQAATEELISSLSRGNPDLKRESEYERALVGNRDGAHTVLSNTSEATMQPETIELFTTLLRDGSLFYMIGVAPRDASDVYPSTFQRVASSIQING
jgi:Zn-dependent protease with chaperone function